MNMPNKEEDDFDIFSMLDNFNLEENKKQYQPPVGDNIEDKDLEEDPLPKLDDDERTRSKGDDVGGSGQVPDQQYQQGGGYQKTDGDGVSESGSDVDNACDEEESQLTEEDMIKLTCEIDEMIDDFNQKYPDNEKIDKIIDQWNGFGGDPTEKLKQEIREELKEIEAEEDKEKHKKKMNAPKKEDAEKPNPKMNTPIEEIPPDKRPKMKTRGGEIFSDPYHYQLRQIKRVFATRDDKGHVMPLYLYGAAGSGKSILAEQIARIFDLDIYRYNFGPTTTESKVEGYRNLISGEFIEGWLYQPYKNGGILSGEEIDAADSGVMAFLNTPISDTKYRFSNGEVVKKHKNFAIIFTANTNGTGSFGGYIRNRIDAALLDRFIKIEMQYDELLEKHIATNQMVCKAMQACRAACDKNSIQAIVSLRAIINASLLYDTGIEKDLTKLSRMTWAHQMNDDTTQSLVSQVTKPAGFNK